MYFFNFASCEPLITYIDSYVFIVYMISQLDYELGHHFKGCLSLKK